MNQKKNCGFTLIELLAVIVILAIIALIAVPVIMNIINKANKSAFKDTAYGIIQAGELYYAEKLLEPNGMTEDVTITLPDTTKKLQIKGEVPNGSITITKEGKVAIAVQNGRYCVTKGLDDKDITVTEDVANCKLLNPNSLTALATISTEVTSIPSCLTDGTICTSGTPVAIKVNSTVVYNFYVLSETNNEVTLIMDRNLGDNVAWISASDYVEANADDNTVCDYDACVDEGPITAVRVLKGRTSSWTNIPERVYTYSDDSGENKYESFSETMRARMLTETEFLDIWKANGRVPSWMYINLKNTGDNNTVGYWLSTVTTGPYDKFTTAWHLLYDLDLGGSVYSKNVCIDTSSGVRPVITLTK